MEKIKYGADLLTETGRIGGHIIITNEKIIWKPVKFGFIGNIGDTEIPITDIEGYTLKGTSLAIGVSGMNDLLEFYTFKGKKIAETLTVLNPNIRMYASNEFVEKKGGGFALLCFMFAIITLGSFLI